MAGRIVNDGTPPPHFCDEIVAPGRPSKYDLNEGAVWRCECGRYWRVYELRVADTTRWTRLAAVLGSSCSQILTGIHPALRSLWSVSLSLLWVAWNFSSHHSELDFGRDPWSGHMCQ